MPQDVLSDALARLQLRGNVYCRSEFSVPWALRFQPGQAFFHFIERGQAVLQADAAPQPLTLNTGDLVLLPRGAGHVLGDQPGRRAVLLDNAVKRNLDGERMLLRHGGGGAQTSVICGSFSYDESTAAPLVGLLPPVIHVVARQAGGLDLLTLCLHALADESRALRPGHVLSMSRLIDLIFLQALRGVMSELDQIPPSWLAALKDPAIGRALGMMHAEPAQAWSVQSLARGVGLSRSPFAARFTQRVGQSPMHYLAALRMSLARQLLSQGALSVQQVADRVGYGSEAAFARAFRADAGQTPSAYRARRIS